MVPPPSYVKAVALKNSTPHTVKVTATFGSDEMEAEGKARVSETRELAPQAEVTIEEHTYDMGGWTAVAALDSLKVEHASEGPLGETLFSPAPTGIVDLLHVNIGAKADTNVFHVAPVIEE